MNKLAPVLVERKRKPRVVVVKETVSRPFEQVWPSILEDMVQNPHMKSRDLWNKWRGKIDNVFDRNQFWRLLKRNNITPTMVRQRVSIPEQAEVALTTFASGKKTFAENHNRRIHQKLEQIHDVVEGISVTEDNVIEVLEIVGRLQKEGRITYDIDSDKPVDKTVVNLALMMGFDARPKAVTVI